MVTRAIASPQSVFWYLVFLASGVVIYYVSKLLGDSSEFLNYSSAIDDRLRTSRTPSKND